MQPGAPQPEKNQRLRSPNPTEVFHPAFDGRISCLFDLEKMPFLMGGED